MRHGVTFEPFHIWIPEKGVRMREAGSQSPGRSVDPHPSDFQGMAAGSPVQERMGTMYAVKRVKRYSVMPLRPEVRALYNTAAYRRERREFIKAAGGPYCSLCGKYDPRVNLAHLSHNPRDKWNRGLLCFPCHAKNDKHQRHAMTRRTLAKRCGQLWLGKDIELAPFPIDTWPVKVRQIEMFGGGA